MATATTRSREDKHNNYDDGIGHCEHYFRRCKFVSPCCQNIYSLRNIFAPFVNYLTTALKETTIIAINAEYVVLQTMKGTYRHCVRPLQQVSPSS